MEVHQTAKSNSSLFVCYPFTLRDYYTHTLRYGMIFIAPSIATWPGFQYSLIPKPLTTQKKSDTEIKLTFLTLDVDLGANQIVIIA